MGTFFQLLVRSLETGSVYALAALGIIIIFRTSNIVNYAQGTIGMFGTYVTAFILAQMGVHVIVAILMAVVSSLALGMLIDFLVIRRAAKVSPIAKQIITLGILMVLLGVTPMIFGVDLMMVSKIIENGEITFGEASLSYNGLLNIVIGLALMFGMFFVLQKTKFGLALRATASNETTARMLGIPSKNVTMFAWAFAAALGCLAGVMIAPSTTVTLTLMDSVQMNAMLACVLGGFQTFYGPVLGAYILGILKNFMMYYVSSVWGEQIVYLLVFIMMVFRPNGLVGKARVKKV